VSAPAQTWKKGREIAIDLTLIPPSFSKAKKQKCLLLLLVRADQALQHDKAYHTLSSLFSSADLPELLDCF
jgi:hypothetical protein